MKCNEIAHSNEIDVTDHDVFSVVKLYSKLKTYAITKHFVQRKSSYITSI